jgi:hypothetical protein
MVCVSHPSVPATYQCSRCQRAYCALCIKQLNAGGRLLEVCARCNAPLIAPSATAGRAPLEPRALVGRVLAGEGLLTAAAIALPGALTWVPGFGTLFKLMFWGSLVGYYFQIIVHVGDDKPGLPGAADALDDVPALVSMTVRGCLCAAVGAIPYYVWLYGGGSGAAGTALGLLVVGMTYMPAVLIAVVLTGSTLGALYPIAWLKIAARAPRSYLLLVLLFVGTLLALSLILTAAGMVAGWIPLVGAFITNGLLCLILFAQAALVGGFLRRHAEDFGYA